MKWNIFPNIFWIFWYNILVLCLHLSVQGVYLPFWGCIPKQPDLWRVYLSYNIKKYIAGYNIFKHSKFSSGVWSYYPSASHESSIIAGFQIFECTTIARYYSVDSALKQNLPCVISLIANPQTNHFLHNKTTLLLPSKKNYAL